MIARSISRTTVADAIAPYPELVFDFDAGEFASNPENFVYLNENDDVALFAKVRPGVYRGHYFFKSRGKEAESAAKEFLSAFFSHEGVDVIEGLTPVQCKGALMLTRRLGFTDYGIVELPQGLCHLSILTRNEYKELQWAS